jgi:hypothetical protein
MTPLSPKPPRPLTLTTTDITQTRYGSGHVRMSWPVDPDTTTRLRRVIRLEVDAPLPWWRRVLRWLKRVGQTDL